MRRTEDTPALPRMHRRSAVDRSRLAAALIRAQLTRYHGVFAANAALRAAITPAGRGSKAHKSVWIDMSGADVPNPFVIR